MIPDSRGRHPAARGAPVTHEPCVQSTARFGRPPDGPAGLAEAQDEISRLLGIASLGMVRDDVARHRCSGRGALSDLAPKLGERFELLLDAGLKCDNPPGQFARNISLLKMPREELIAQVGRERGDLPGTGFHLRLEIFQMRSQYLFVFVQSHRQAVRSERVSPSS